MKNINKEQLLQKYLHDMSLESDELRKVFPNTNFSDGTHMKNGFEFCQRKSVNWIEQLLDSLDLQQTPVQVEQKNYFNSKPISQVKTDTKVNSEKNEKLKKIGTALGGVGSDILKAIGGSGSSGSPIRKDKDLYKI